MADLSRIEELFTPECRLCPRECGVNRKQNETGYCGVGKQALVSSSFPHRGEERPLSGRRGSGTIFLAGCNLRCVFCQNAEISHGLEGRTVRQGELVSLMLNLQEHGCHNINFVTPTHCAAQLAAAIKEAKDEGLEIPVVYNCGGYESVEVLEAMEGLIDIYMPDFKFWSDESSEKYMNASDYPEVTRQAVKEMHAQVGDLETDGQGIATQGLLVRHLVMPEGEEESKKIIEWLKEEISPHTYLNIMPQYRPACEAYRYPELDKPLRIETHREVENYARKIGLTNLD